jgi:hypothetical protein
MPLRKKYGLTSVKADHAEAIKPHLVRIDNLNREIDRLTSEGKAIAKADETAEEKARLERHDVHFEAGFCGDLILHRRQPCQN